MNYSIKIVSRRTGLTPHVIRVWEKRYKAVQPERTDTNRRLYSEEEITRLNLLRHLTQAGHNIGSIATLEAGELSTLLHQQQEHTSQGTKAPAPPSATPTAENFLASGIASIRALNATTLEKTLSEALLSLGHQGLLRNVISPLTQKVGELWMEGDLTAAHEHFATALIRVFLSHAIKPFAVSGNAPVIIVSTPAGQLHELGAVIVAAAATAIGWRVTYLGPSLPAAEIASAAIQNKARAVALSIVYPEDDPDLPEQLEAIRRFLPKETTILVGGRAASAYSKALEGIGAVDCSDLGILYRQLDLLRNPTRV